MRKKATKKKSQHQYLKLTPLTITSGVVFIIISLLFITIISYQLAYMGKIYPGIKIAGINIGNKTPTEAQTLLENKFADFQKAGLTLSFNNEVKNYQLTDLGISFDSKKQVATAYQIGRNLNFFDSVIQKIKAWRGDFELNPQLKRDGAKIDSAVSYFSSKVTGLPQPMKISFFNNQIQIQPATNGQILDTASAREKISSTLKSFSISPIMLGTVEIKNQSTPQELETYRQKLQNLVTNPITLTFNDKKWTITGEDLVKLVDTDSKNDVNLLDISVLNQSYQLGKTSDRSKNTINLNQESLNDYVETIASQINQDPKDAKFSFENNRVTIFTPSNDGQKLDEKDTVNKISTLFSILPEDGPTQPITLKVDITKSQLTTESVNNLGIKELIGSGTTTFFHSIPNRAANVGLASSRINGTLVAPGEIFSMSKTVGEVDASTGYKEAYIISQGKTQLDFGGGVCQVSTTLFRTALNSGLPIVERHPHAYRVGYYEQNSAPGIDASVFFPSLDFKFKNDTGNYILIQTIFNGPAYSLTFNFYGTKDGRTVSMTKPVISNQIPAPPDLNQDDPTLPLGTIKQIDFAAAGATTSFSRTVTKNGSVIIQDTFTSKYQPWQAIYLHGTKVS